MVRYLQKCVKQIAGICGFRSQASIMSCSCNDNEINPQGMFFCGLTLWSFLAVDCLWRACESLRRVVCGEHWCNFFGDNQEEKHFEMFPSFLLHRQYLTWEWEFESLLFWHGNPSDSLRLTHLLTVSAWLTWHRYPGLFWQKVDVRGKI